MGAGAVLTLVGKDLIRLLLGAKWAEAGHIFTFFGPGIGIMLVYFASGLIHPLPSGERIAGFDGSYEFGVTVLLFLIALPWGPVGIASAWSASFWILFIPSFWYAGRPIQFGVTPILDIVWRYVVASFLAGCASAVIIRETPSLVAAPSKGELSHGIGADLVIVAALYPFGSHIHSGPALTCSAPAKASALARYTSGSQISTAASDARRAVPPSRSAPVPGTCEDTAVVSEGFAARPEQACQGCRVTGSRRDESLYRLVWPGVENQLEELDVFSESLVEIKRVLPTQGRKSGVSETVFDSLAAAS